MTGLPQRPPWWNAPLREAGDGTGDWEYLSFGIYWNRDLKRIELAHSGADLLPGLQGAGPAALAHHLRGLDGQGWISVGWYVSEDGAHELYVFKRPMRAGGAQSQMMEG